jgi:ATP-dependent RNA helicase DDX18/HAS1
MFLQPSEVGFLKHLKDARVPLVEFEFPTKRIFNIQSQLEKLIGQNYYLNKVRIPAYSGSMAVKADPPLVPVCQGWLSLLPAGIRFTQSTVDI